MAIRRIRVTSLGTDYRLLTWVMMWAGIASVANAQVLEEVTVTAQKREQSVQDVGIAITAFSGDQITQLGFEDSTAVARLTPGVHLSQSSGGETQNFTIRGVTQNDFNDAIEAPVAVYVDEGYIPMQQGQLFALFDLDRVEILKGPQGTLFGRNATGGLVHYVTRKPTDAFEAFADVTYGSYDQVRMEAAVSGPLVEKLTGRLSVMYNRHDEIYNNLYPFGATRPSVAGGGQDFWNQDVWGVRGQLQFAPTENLDVLVSGYGSRQEIGESPYQSIGAVPIFDSAGRVINSIRAAPNEVREAIGPGGVGVDISPLLDGDVDGLRPVPGGDLYGYRDPDGEDFDTSKDFAFDDINEYETYGVTGKAEWTLGDLNVTAVSHYMHFDKTLFNDVDAAPVPLSVFQAQAETDTFAQELRVSGELRRARWVAGFYYLYIDNETTNGLMFPAASPISVGLGGIVGAPTLPIEATNLIALETNSYSLFGQMDVDLTDSVTFIAGLRAILEEKDYSYEQLFFANLDDLRVETNTTPLPLPFAYPSFTDDESETLWTGKLQLDYRPVENWLIYAGFNRGVKAGSYNAKINDFTPPLPPEDIPYGEEVLYSYEAGFKSTLFDGTTRFNGSIYFYDYKDYQAFVFTQSSGTVTNADAEVKGVELEMITSPVQGLDLMLGLSLIDADVENLEVAPSVFKEVTPSFTPSVQLSGLARYEWTAFGGRLAAQADAQYVSNSYHNIRNFQSQKMPSYLVGNARLTWYSPSEHWNLSFFVNNIADARYLVTGFDIASLCGCNEEAYGKPRWYGASLRYEF